MAFNIKYIFSLCLVIRCCLPVVYNYHSFLEPTCLLSAANGLSARRTTFLPHWEHNIDTLSMLYALYKRPTVSILFLQKINSYCPYPSNWMLLYQSVAF